ncbi:MAG: BrnA antitoxin family protein [Nevskiales bacterium]
MSKPKISRYSSKALAAKRAKGADRTNWAKVRGMGAATIAHNARGDADNPPLTERDFARAKLVRRGRPKLANPKQQVTLRLSSEVLAHYRAKGRGWQTRIDEDLKKLAG